ncbi:FAD-dependent oxidoreductase [Cereibacter sphaeroides]|nr:FAD-dependent oxidoreductase [Cereibacter sphaeroides]
MATPDLTIRGGGIFGLAVAWAAVRRGAKVRLIESARIGAGSSGGVVGALSPHVPEQWNEKKAFQFESLAMGEAWWAAVADASGLPTGYDRLGRFQPLADARAVDHARARAEGGPDPLAGPLLVGGGAGRRRLHARKPHGPRDPRHADRAAEPAAGGARAGAGDPRAGRRDP